MYICLHKDMSLLMVTTGRSSNTFRDHDSKHIAMRAHDESRGIYQNKENYK